MPDYQYQYQYQYQAEDVIDARVVGAISLGLGILLEAANPQASMLTTTLSAVLMGSALGYLDAAIRGLCARRLNDMPSSDYADSTVVTLYTNQNRLFHLGVLPRLPHENIPKSFAQYYSSMTNKTRDALEKTESEVSRIFC